MLKSSDSIEFWKEKSLSFFIKKSFRKFSKKNTYLDFLLSRVSFERYGAHVVTKVRTITFEVHSFLFYRDDAGLNDHRQ